MFYSGDLRSGIQLAIQEAKSVVCFVRDETPASDLWENEYLKDEQITTLLESETVALRLIAGSQEAGFLGAIAPLTTYPTLVVINNGALTEYIAGEVAKEDLVDRVNKALRAQEQAQTNPAESVTMTVEEHNDDGTTTTVGPEQGMPVAPETASRIMSNLESRPEYERAPTEESATAQIQSEAEASHPPAAPPATNDLLNEAPDRSVSSVLSERRERLEAHKKAQEAAQRAERARIAARRKEELELAAAAAAADPKRAAELKQRQEVRKRQQEEKAARERILKKIEDDKKERAARDAERKAAAKAADGKENAEYSTFQSPAAKRGDICGLQIRLFDGSTIRNRFPSSSTLEKDVRPWIDVEQQIAGSPYTFKQILAPLPSKSISESEEVQTLQDLGLVPNATLVLVPIASYQTAYETGGGGVAGTVGGAVRGVASVGMGLVGSVVGVPLGFAARALGRVIGTDGVPYSSPAVPKDEPKGDESARKSEGHVMYNGGGINFEPRRDKDDKED